MKNRIFNRTLGVLLSILLLWSSFPAQDALGPYKLLSPTAPTRRSTRSLTQVLRPGRPMLGYVGLDGGVAFDTTASPARGVAVDSMAVSYLPRKLDGQRLSLTVNGQAVSTEIYDWQLIPIAKFVNSDMYSCVTLFGTLDDPDEEEKYVKEGGSILNYHPNLKDTLMGLRLFQLDILIFDEQASELPTRNGTYILGAGESSPNKENKAALVEFQKYKDQNQALFKSYASYVITDPREGVAFDIKDGKLNINGEPYYYFWSVDELAYMLFNSGVTLTDARTSVVEELDRLRRARRPQKPWLIEQIETGIKKYKQEIADYDVVQTLKYLQLESLLSADDARLKVLLHQQSVGSLIDRLAELRALEKMPVPQEIPELGQMVASKTQMLRAINPAVWDAGVTTMRYAAFFRYIKNKHPQQWQSFMAQIERAPAPKPPVITPTVLMPPPI